MDNKEKIAEIMAKRENMSVSDAMSVLSNWHDDILKISLIVQYSELIMEKYNIPMKARNQHEWIKDNQELAHELELLSNEKVWWNLGSIGLSIRAYDLHILLDESLYAQAMPESKWSLRNLFGYTTVEWNKVKRLLNN